MGRYSQPLAPQFADFAGVVTSQQGLDVGCGPGALTGELVRRLGPWGVRAVDPSESFVAAAQARFPGVSIQRAAAEDLPFADHEFDIALAQLVVHFMKDPVTGLREMRRVTHPGGTVAACVWDHAGGQGPLAVFWEAARLLDPSLTDESHLAGTREGHLAQLFDQAGLNDVETGVLSVNVDHPGFDEWWEPFTLGVGPAGAYAAALDPDRRMQLREQCRRSLPPREFSVTARAWSARATA